MRQLVELGLVVEDAAGATTGGRPAGRLRVNPAGGVVLAASIGASKTKLGVCDLAGAVLAETGLDLDATLGPEVVLRTVAERLDRLREKADQPVRGVGVCVPGPVDVATAHRAGVAAHARLGRRADHARRHRGARARRQRRERADPRRAPPSGRG